MNIKPLILAIGLLLPLVSITSCTPYANLVTRQEDGLVTLTRALAAVNDQRSADLAAVAVASYGGLLMSDIQALIAKGRPSMLDLLLLKNNYQNSNIKDQSKQCLAQVFRVASNGFYGSQELPNALVRMLRGGN